MLRIEPPTHFETDKLWALSLGIVAVTFKQPVPEDARCHYCGGIADTRDHIVPETLLGRDAWWNLVPACFKCNDARGQNNVCNCAWCKRARKLFELGLRREKSQYQARRQRRKNASVS